MALVRDGETGIDGTRHLGPMRATLVPLCRLGRQHASRLHGSRVDECMNMDMMAANKLIYTDGGHGGMERERDVSGGFDGSDGRAHLPQIVRLLVAFGDVCSWRLCLVAIGLGLVAAIDLRGWQRGLAGVGRLGVGEERLALGVGRLPERR